MRFVERKEFLYDPALFGRADTQTVLRIYAAYVEQNAARPYPKVLEVDRTSARFDPVWHVPLDERVVFSREIDVPMTVKVERPSYRMTRIGVVPQQRCRFEMANLHLQQADWFPMRGDYIFWNGYRNLILNVVFEPNAFWGQTNVWTGLVCETVIPAEGDARPVLDPGHPVPRELIQTRLAPEV